ncbi:integrase [Gossypium australe]|uniref:Integrase n=1 Tax=Gossypium australe TaxID=47621 RepID=A0A5B6WRL2_9ROSI|nr:integrase [Gossypium australe]
MDFVSGLLLTLRKEDTIWITRCSVINYFVSRPKGKLQKALGTKLKFITAFHPQTDGQSERKKFILLVEFSYNNHYQSSIKMAPYEALYGRKCRTPLYWTELSDRKISGTNLICDIEDKVKIIWDFLKVGEKVFLNVSPWKKVLRFGRKRKLSPRFDPSHVISSIDVELQPNMSYSEEPIKILAQEIKELRNKCIMKIT